MIGSKKHPMMACPKCKYKFCFNCRTDEWHAGTTCENFQKWKAENGQGEAKFAEWAQTNSKICPKCNVRIEKNGGCDHMTCWSCKYEFYWTTGAKYP